MKTMTDALNHTTTYGYDKQGRQVWTIDAKGYLTESKYDDKSQLIETWSSDGTKYSYNATTDTLVVLQAGNPADRQIRKMDYDDAGRKIAETDPLDRVTKFVYDKAGRLVESIAPDLTPTIPQGGGSANDTDNARTETEYYSDGLVKAQIDAKGNRTEFRYDELGRQIAVIAADATPNDLSDNPTSRYVFSSYKRIRILIDLLGYNGRNG
jgi:YD repeat-containing protein